MTILEPFKAKASLKCGDVLGVVDAEKPCGGKSRGFGKLYRFTPESGGRSRWVSDGLVWRV